MATPPKPPAKRNRERERELSGYARHDASPKAAPRRTDPPQASGVRVSKRQLATLAADVQAVQQWKLETGQSASAAVDALFEIGDKRARELFIAAVDFAYPSARKQA